MDIDVPAPYTDTVGTSFIQIIYFVMTRRDLPPIIKSVYCATLGHKANHAFPGDPRRNARWSRLDHPRFGLICALTADRDIAGGEEVLVDYGLWLADAPGWYR